MYVILLIAPFSLAVGRFLVPIVGAHGLIALVALVLFPISEWLAGIGARQYIVMVRLARFMECEHGKPVVVVADEV